MSFFKRNNNQISNTSYYQLPCGKYLEDFIWWMGLNFSYGSALKYLWRAGHKDGETRTKDMAKAEHYIRSIATRTGSEEVPIRLHITQLCENARSWDGDDENGR